MGFGLGFEGLGLGLGLDSSDILHGGIQVAANGASKAREGKLTS